MATKKQSRPIVEGLANPQGVTAVYGTPIDWGSLPEKIRIGRRIANGRFKLEAHYPAKQFNDKKEYIDKRKAGSYCRFYDNKSPFFIARTVWDATSHPGMHMVVKHRNETYRFIVTPKAGDPTEATVIGAYLVHRGDGVPVLCSGPIGELKAVGDDGDFKVTAYKKHGIRCPKKDSSGKDLAGEIPKTFGYTKRTSKKGPRKTAKDYCKPSHTFKHPTDIKRAEVVEEMDAYMDEQCTCLMCNWSGAYSDLAFLDDTAEGGPPGMDFMLVCPSCGDGDWLDDMMAEGYDEPCFSCDGIGTWDDGECEYCQGSGMMSDNLRAEMAIYNSEYFDADCGCFKKAETLSFMDWAKQEETSHLKKYGAEGDTFTRHPVFGIQPSDYKMWLVKEYPHADITKEQHDEIIEALDKHDPNKNIYYVRYADMIKILTPHGPLKASFLPTFSAESDQFPSMHYGDYDSDAQEKYQEVIDEWDLDDDPPSFEKWISDWEDEPEPPAEYYEELERRREEDYQAMKELYGAEHTITPDFIYSQWDKVVREDLTLEESGINYEVIDSADEADVVVYDGVLLIPRHLYDEIAESLSSGGEAIQSMADTFAGELGIDEMRCPDCGTQSLEFPINQSLHCDRCGSNFYDAETFEADFERIGKMVHQYGDTASSGERAFYEGLPELRRALNTLRPLDKYNKATVCQFVDEWANNHGDLRNLTKAVHQLLAQDIERIRNRNAETFEAPYAGAGALMGIKGDSALSSFTPSELTESSAIHGDFDQASLNYSGHQNIEVRAEGWGKTCQVEDRDTDEPCTAPATVNLQDILMEYEVGEDPYEKMHLGEINEFFCKKHYDEMDDMWAETKGSEHQNIEVRAEDAETYKCKDCGGPVVEVLKYAEGYGKRQRFGNRYVARNTQGEFISNVGVGASLKADRRNKSKTPTSSGFGNKGDSQKTPPVWAKPLGYVGALAAGWISASMIDNAKE